MTDVTPPPWWNVLACRGTALPPHLLLVAKLVTFLLLLVETPLKFPEPFLPFLPFFDALPGTVFRLGLTAGFCLAAAGLFCNRRVRVNAIALGVIGLVAILSSKPYYSNGRFFCSAVLLLVGLQPTGSRAWLLEAQLVLVYFGAGLNKILDPDWRSGQFFESWMRDIVQNGPYIYVASWLPTGWLSQAMCWTVIAFELAFSALLAMRIHAAVLIWGAVLFHAGSLVLSGSMFGEFMPAIFISFLALVPWPTVVTAEYAPGHALVARVVKLFRAFDWDDLVQWRSVRRSDDAPPLVVVIDGHRRHGVDAARWLVLLHPTVFFVFLFFFVGPMMSQIYRDTVFGVALVGMMPLERLFTRRSVWEAKRGAGKA